MNGNSYSKFNIIPTSINVISNPTASIIKQVPNAINIRINTLTKRLEKKLDGNYTRMLRAILNKSWRQHPTRHQLYGHLPPITKTIKVRWTRHAEHCWRSRDELISDVLLWTPTYGWAKAGPPARTYIQQLCEDTGCSPEDLPESMNDREKWRERVRDIRASSMTWWWWWWLSSKNIFDNHKEICNEAIHNCGYKNELKYLETKRHHNNRDNSLEKSLN